MIKFSLDATTNTRCRDCWGIFLDALKKNFDEFAMYTKDEFYFNEPQERYVEETDEYLPAITEQDVQTWIDNFECHQAQNELYDSENNFAIDAIIKLVDPTISENLPQDQLWVNKKTGDIFTCINNTQDKNIWVGTKSGRIIRPVPPVNKFDFFEDNSAVAFYQMNKNALDVGGKYNGQEHSIKWVKGLDGECARSNSSSYIRVSGLPFDSDTEAVTISAWVNWNKTNNTMAFGFNRYDLWCYGGNLGFNTSNGDLTGFSMKEYQKKWIYLTVVFRKGVPGEIYIDGIQKDLDVTQRNFSSGNAKMGSVFTIFGWSAGAGYKDFGRIERLRIFDRALTSDEVQLLAQGELDFINDIGAKR